MTCNSVSQSMDNITIRWMKHKDIPTIADIENECFTDNWGEDYIASTLDDNHTIVKVATLEGTVRGYNFYTPTKECFQILNMAVEPEHRKKLIGTYMIADMFKNSEHFKRNIDSWVCETKIDMLAFLKKHGFKPIMLVKNLFTSGDGILMRFTFNSDFEIYDRYIKMIDDRQFTVFYD